MIESFLTHTAFAPTMCPIVWILEVGPKTRRIRATMKSYIVELNGSRMQPAKDSLMGSSGRAPQQGSPVSRSASDLRPIFFKLQPRGRPYFAISERLPHLRLAKAGIKGNDVFTWRGGS